MTPAVEKAADVARVPRNFAFPVNPTGSLKLEVTTLSGEAYALLVGGVAPLGGGANGMYLGLTMRHQRVILRALYGKGFDSPEVPVSLTELLPGSLGGGKYARLNQVISELANAWVHVIPHGKAEVRSVRLVNFEGEIRYRRGVIASDTTQIRAEENIHVRRLKNLIFAPEFWRACLNYQDCWAVRVDAIDEMSSDLAAYSFLKLAPNTHNPSKPAGWKYRRDARGLLLEAGLKADEPRRIQENFQRQRGKTPSVLEQMDQKSMWKDVFRVAPELEKNADGTGFNVVYWRGEVGAKARAGQTKRIGVLEQIWIRETGSAAGFFDPIKKEWERLEYHNIEAMQALGYEPAPHRRYLERVRSYIGPVRFDTVIGSVKQALVDAENGGPRIENVGAYLGAAMRSEFEAWLKEYRNARKR